jgi:dipeptidyl-peptidase-3
MNRIKELRKKRNITQIRLSIAAEVSQETISAYENGKAENVIELDTIDGKTFIKVNDYDKLRALFGSLLKEIQRIKSEGDYEAGRNMVEKYAVKVNPDLHKEVLDRYAALNIAPYKGFVNPIYTPVYDAEGKIVDVTLNFEEDYVSQMLRYSRDYSPLTK